MLSVQTFRENYNNIQLYPTIIPRPRMVQFKRRDSTRVEIFHNVKFSTLTQFDEAVRKMSDGTDLFIEIAFIF